MPAPLPASMVKRLTQQAEAHFAAAAPARVTDLGDGPRGGAQQVVRSRRLWMVGSGCVFTARIVRLVTTAYADEPTAGRDRAAGGGHENRKAGASAQAADSRRKLSATLLASSESLKVTLAPTKDSAAAGVTADVVWDPATQTGYLHLVGLAVNDPAVRQYQIWIFDGGRDKRYPVDGGVFDVPADSGEVVIPIHATLPVLKLAAFAVTVEKPGGAVVSGREHVVALGTAG